MLKYPFKAVSSTILPSVKSSWCKKCEYICVCAFMPVCEPKKIKIKRAKDCTFILTLYSSTRHNMQN